MSLSVRGLTLRAGPRGRVLCSGLDFAVEHGQRWVLLGPNGAGKSTLLAALAGLITPAEGQVLLDSRALAGWPLDALARERAWCPAQWSDPFPATVAETVRLARPQAPWWLSTASDNDADALQRLLSSFDLAHLAQADVRTLSGGERQRVALAAAWWQSAPRLLLDEPSAQLDLAHQELLLARLLERDGSVVASLHDLNLAWRLATHAVLLDGRGNATAGERASVMQPERLATAFGVPIAWVEVCGQQRLWVGPMDRAA